MKEQPLDCELCFIRRVCLAHCTVLLRHHYTINSLLFKTLMYPQL